MKKLTVDLINTWNPCYNPTRYLQAGKEYSITTFLKMEDIPIKDRFWVVLRKDLLSDRTLRLFAVFCGRQVEHLMTDPRSRAALDVAERFANGLATEEELKEAREEAWKAYYDAAWLAADLAAGASAAADAAALAALAAATAARSAADLAAGASAARSAAAADAAAAQTQQRDKLIELVEAEIWRKYGGKPTKKRPKRRSTKKKTTKNRKKGKK